ncbi:hypothetical protein PoB_001875200 [Plakobranchus ocellatus]|uniref:Uncharacterized protein n=1 Tax=Plakobranchus ocellatus TaxID=259542 RepID=A0AAV3ZCP4_9GAST|nr:hypothetical protein PoB_001875200 [Plakobranchus ocellatus]
MNFRLTDYTIEPLDFHISRACPALTELATLRSYDAGASLTKPSLSPGIATLVRHQLACCVRRSPETATDGSIGIVIRKRLGRNRSGDKVEESASHQLLTSYAAQEVPALSSPPYVNPCSLLFVVLV